MTLAKYIAALTMLSCAVSNRFVGPPEEGSRDGARMQSRIVFVFVIVASSPTAAEADAEAEADKARHSAWFKVT